MIISIDRIINSVFSSNTYVLTKETFDWCWLIDIGDLSPILDMIPDRMFVKGVFLTHTHYDHMYGINKLIELFPDCIVYTCEEGKKGLFSDKYNFSRYHNDSIIFKGKRIKILSEGDEIELFPNERLKTIETPGHDSSCLSYFNEDFVFSGDSYIPGIKVIATFPKSDKLEAALSQDKIIQVALGKKVFPGHGESVIVSKHIK